MTDNEVMKALECCSNQMYSCTDKQCKAKTLGNALDLINRLQAENRVKDYFAKLVPQQKETIDNQEAEIERLKDILICFMGALSKVRNIDDIESISVIPLMTELNKGIRAEIKIEAYKEFAERLNADVFNTEYHLDKYYRRTVNNLLKELVGGDNA